MNREASHLGIQGLVQTSIIPQKGDQRYGFFRFSTAFWWASIDWLNKQYCYVMLGVKEIFSEAPNLNLWPHKLNIWNPRLIIMIIISLILWCTNPTFKKQQVTLASPGSKRREGHPPHPKITTGIQVTCRVGWDLRLRDGGWRFDSVGFLIWVFTSWFKMILTVDIWD